MRCLMLAARSVILGVTLIAAGARGDDLAVLSGRPDAQEALGAAFESRANGIALRPPAACTKVLRRTVSGDEIAEFISEDKNWVLKLSRVSFGQPVEMNTYKDAGGNEQPGLMEMTIEQFKRSNPGAQILRQDVTSAAGCDVAMLAMRYTLGAQHRLTQQGLIQANDQLYYILTLTSPGAADANAPPSSIDPREQEAVGVFRKVLDSVKLLDRGALKEEQDQRLFRTRALFVNLTEARLRKAMIPQQWLRLVRDGKDVGYTYVVEEMDEQGPLKGVRIGIRSRTVPEKGMQVDAESWLRCSFDRRHEEWSNSAVVESAAAPGQKNFVTEIGTSDRQLGRVKDETLPRDKTDPGQPPMRSTESYTLTVTTVSRTTNGQPVTQPLPPFYLPQALGHLLPRLVPINEPKSYMFATWVSDQHAVVARYIDVERDQTVNLGGHSVRAVPIKDRIGLEGSVTTHYVSLEGAYLGSVNEDSKITILPSDARTLTSLWAGANLSRPSEPPAKPPR